MSSVARKGIRNLIDAILDGAERVAVRRKKSHEPIDATFQASARMNFVVDKDGTLALCGKVSGPVGVAKAELESKSSFGTDSISEGDLEIRIDVRVGSRFDPESDDALPAPAKIKQ